MIRRSVLLVLVGLVLAGCAGVSNPVVPNVGTGTDTGAHPSNTVSQTTIAGVTEPVDAQVLGQLMAHHRQAIDIASQALQRGERQEARTLAATVVETKNVELRRMEAWQREWFPNENVAVPAGPAVVLPNNASADEAFLAALIPVYEQGIATAREADGRVQHDQLQTLIKSIISQQGDTLNRMKRWQTEWAQDQG